MVDCSSPPKPLDEDMAKLFSPSRYLQTPRTLTLLRPPYSHCSSYQCLRFTILNFSYNPLHHFLFPLFPPHFLASSPLHTIPTPTTLSNLHLGGWIYRGRPPVDSHILRADLEPFPILYLLFYSPDLAFGINTYLPA